MSIQTELARIKGAKADLRSWVEENGVTVPDGTLIDGLVELAKTVETGGGGGSIIVGTFTPEEDISSITLPDVVYKEDHRHFLAIFYDPNSGTSTSGHFQLGIDVYYSRVARYYSSTMNEYSPILSYDNIIKVYNANFQAGITYRYIFTKDLW